LVVETMVKFSLIDVRAPLYRRVEQKII